MSISQDSSRFTKSFDDVPCVWMTAGVLAYQLCNREYDCDACPLDIALRKHFSRESKQVEQDGKTHQSDERPALREDYWYSEKHCWVQRRNEETFRVGIEPQLARALLIPKSIVLPSQGQQLKRNQSSVWIVLEQGTFPVVSPLDGVVVARNALIAEQPSHVLHSSYDDGWLYELICGKKACDALLNFQDAHLLFERDRQKFNSMLATALKPETPALGPTLADGGAPLQHVADMLGYSKYMKIVKSIFG